MRDPYEVLGVDPGASDAEIKRAYRRLARETHPDRNPDDPTAEARFKEVARAWEVLSDPARRAELARRGRGRAAGGLPEDFLDDVASAVERAQTWIEAAVLPEIARFHRGVGAEMAVRFWVDLPRYAPPRVFERPGIRERRRAAHIARRVQVDLESWPGGAASQLTRHRTHLVLLINPAALWEGGIREADAVDDVVMQLMLARYAQVVAQGHPLTDLPVDGDAERARWAVDRARERDDAAVREWRLRWAGWLALVLFLGVLMYFGYVSRYP